VKHALALAAACGEPVESIFVVSRLKHDFACFGVLFPKVGASSSKDFAFFHQTGDNFAKSRSPEPPGPHGRPG
jgi:hypothetical protein